MALETHSRVVYQRETEPSFQQASRPPGPLSPDSAASESAREAALGGGAAAGLFGLATGVLSILGLLNIVPLYLAAIAGITAGAAFLAEGGGTAAWYSQLTGRFAEARDAMSSQAMGALAAIVLSILALIGISSLILLPVAILVLGTSIFLGSWGSASGGKFLVGLASLVLGIVALVGFQPLTLCLVAFLSLGCSAFLSGGVFAGKMLRTQS